MEEYAKTMKQFQYIYYLFPNYFNYFCTNKSSRPVCRTHILCGRKVRATQSILLPNRKLSARV